VNGKLGEEAPQPKSGFLHTPLEGVREQGDSAAGRASTAPIPPSQRSASSKSSPTSKTRAYDDLEEVRVATEGVHFPLPPSRVTRAGTTKTQPGILWDHDAGQVRRPADAKKAVAGQVSQFEPAPFRQSANLWWPDDRAWPPVLT
jgi:hypothetical protein